MGKPSAQDYHIGFEEISNFVKKLACSYESMFVMNTKRNFQTIIKLCYYSKMLNKHNTLLNYFVHKKKQHWVSVINRVFFL
jgi:hypothetical protein